MPPFRTPALAVYVDLDGVMADFEHGARRLVGTLDNNLNRRYDLLSPELQAHKARLYTAIAAEPEFYATLPLLPGALDLWARVRPFDPAVLTASPSFGTQPDPARAIADAQAGKRVWCESGLGLDDPARFFCCVGPKHPYVGRRPGRTQLLIDDRPDNCGEWAEAGGVAILHRNVPDTLAQFDALIERLGLDHEGRPLPRAVAS